MQTEGGEAIEILILSVAKDSYRLATGSPDSMTKLEVTVTVTV